MSATGETPGLTTTSSPTAMPVDGVADRVDDAGDVAAGHVRQRRLRQAPRDPQVHVVEGAGDDPDAHVVGAERAAGRSSPHRYAAGRLVQDPGVQRDPPQVCTVARVGVDGDARASVRCPAPTPSTHSPSGRSNGHDALRHAVPCGSPGAGRGCPSAGAAAPASGPAPPIARVDLDDVGPAVVRVGPRRDVPPARGGRRSSRRRSGRATPPTGGRGRRRGRRRRAAARRRRRAARRSGTAAAPAPVDGPPSVRSRSPPTSRTGRSSPGARWAASVGVGGDVDEAGRRGHRLAPRLAAADRHRPAAAVGGDRSADDAVGDDAAERPLGDLPGPLAGRRRRARRGPPGGPGR